TWPDPAAGHAQAPRSAIRRAGMAMRGDPTDRGYHSRASDRKALPSRGGDVGTPGTGHVRAGSRLEAVVRRRRGRPGRAREPGLPDRVADGTGARGGLRRPPPGAAAAVAAAPARASRTRGDLLVRRPRGIAARRP